MKRLLGFVMFLLGFSLTILAQPAGSIPQEPGKCYEKSMMPHKWEHSVFEIPVYNGLDSSQYVVDREYVLRGAYTKWKKVKADRGCASGDPNDCLVWCLVEVPAEVIELNIVVDTFKEKNFILETYESSQITQLGGQTQWTEVVCQNKVSRKLVKSLSNVLYELGYYHGDIVKKITPELKAALFEFQRQQSLPVGNLNVETMELLGLDH